MLSTSERGGKIETLSGNGFYGGGGGGRFRLHRTRCAARACVVRAEGFRRIHCRRTGLGLDTLLASAIEITKDVPELYKGLYETEAITLRTYKLGDADKIVVLLTKQNGLVRGVARGARRLKSRFGACLEPCTHTSISFREKEGQELVKLGQAEIIRSYFDLSREPKNAAILEYLCDLIIHFAPPHEPNEKLFRMTKSCLDAAADAPQDLPLIARYFEIWTLRLGGFLADWRRCVRCGRELTAEHAYALEDGRLCCPQCGKGVALSAKTLEHLQSLQRLTPQAWSRSAGRAGGEIESELGQFTKRAIMYVLERSPRVS